MTIAVVLTAATGGATVSAPPSPRVVAGGPVTACQMPVAGPRKLQAIDGRVPVVLYVPAQAAPGAPLVLALGGSGQTGSDFASYTGYSSLADRKGFVVAYPTAAGARPSWNVSGAVPGRPDDVAYLRKVIAAAVRASCADPAQVGVTGVSNGGGMTARLACDAADLISAAAPVAGGYGSLPPCRPTRPVAILEIHGTRDQVVPYAGKGPEGFGAVPRFLAQWRALNACSARVTRRGPVYGVTGFDWQRCRAGSAVAHERVANAGHGWPGGSDVIGKAGFSATARTWAFLSSYRR